MFPSIPAPFDILPGPCSSRDSQSSCCNRGKEGDVLQVTCRDQTGQGSGCLFPIPLDLYYSSRAISLPYSTLDFWGGPPEILSQKHCSLKRPPGFVTSFLLSPQYPFLCDSSLTFFSCPFSVISMCLVSLLSPWCLMRGVLGSLGGSIRLGLYWILGFECLWTLCSFLFRGMLYLGCL